MGGVSRNVHKGHFAILKGHSAVGVLLGPEAEQVHQVPGALSHRAARYFYVQLQAIAALPCAP